MLVYSWSMGKDIIMSGLFNETTGLNAPFYTSLATALTGVIALIIYSRQKNETKRRAALAVYTEIKSAENKLKDIRKEFFASADRPGLRPQRIMPSQSWDQFKHLFIGTLKDEYWNKIDSFYSNCLAYDEAVKLNDSYFNVNAGLGNANLMKYYNELVLAYNEKTKKRKELEDPIVINNEWILLKNDYAQFEQLALNNVTMYYPVKPVNDARAALTELTESVLTSKAGEALRKAAGIRENSKWLRSI